MLGDGAEGSTAVGAAVGTPKSSGNPCTSMKSSNPKVGEVSLKRKRGSSSKQRDMGSESRQSCEFMARGVVTTMLRIKNDLI